MRDENRNSLEMAGSLYEEVLGPAAFSALPTPIRALHDTRPSKRFEGMATVRRSYGLVTSLVAWLFVPSGRKEYTHLL